MDARAIETICGQIYRRFPEVNGSRPKVQPQAENILLIFKGNAKTADGKSIQRIVRVVASSNGKIIKVTTSR